MQRLAGIAWPEASSRAALARVEIPKVLRHFDRAGLDRRREVPLTEERVDNLRARDYQLRGQGEFWRRDFCQPFQPSEEPFKAPVGRAQ